MADSYLQSLLRLHQASPGDLDLQRRLLREQERQGAKPQLPAKRRIWTVSADWLMVALEQAAQWDMEHGRFVMGDFVNSVS